MHLVRLRACHANELTTAPPFSGYRNTLKECARTAQFQRRKDERKLQQVSFGAHHGSEQRTRTADGQTVDRFDGKTQKDHRDRPESSGCRGTDRNFVTKRSERNTSQGV